MYALSFFAFLLLLSLQSSAQVKEFEGIIHFKHIIQVKDPSVDKSDLVKFAGTASRYLYKEGHYKWIFDGSEMELEYYDGETGNSVNKLRNKPEHFSHEVESKDSIVRYELFKNADTICGYVCDRLKVMIGNRSDRSSAIIRNISFCKDLPVDPIHFKKAGAWCNDEVYAITKSMPLRIEIISSDWPFTLCYLAERVESKTLAKEEVLLPPKTKVKKVVD